MDVCQISIDLINQLGGLAVYKLVGDVKALNAIVLQFTFLYIQG